MECAPHIFKKSASSKIFTPNSCALVSLEPASVPARTKSVFLLTLPVTLLLQTKAPALPWRWRWLLPPCHQRKHSRAVREKPPTSGWTRNPIQSRDAVSCRKDNCSLSIRQVTLSRLEHRAEFLFINNLHAELLRLVEFGSGFGTGQDEIRFLAYAAAHFAAEGFDLSRGFLTRQRRQRAGQHKSFAGKHRSADS